MKNYAHNSKVFIFSTGVYLQALECIIDGTKQWRWVAIGFEEDSFLNGDVVNPVEYANRERDLVKKFDSD